MSKVLDVLKENNVAIFGQLQYEVRPIDERFHAVELSTLEKVPFRMFYYIVDLQDEKVFYGDYSIPDSVTIKRILTGVERHAQA